MHGCRIRVISKYILFMIISILIIPSLGTTWAQNATTAKKPVEFFQLSDKPFGFAYEDHVINYWKIFLPIPVDKSPYEDTTGERCTYAQNATKTVFYLHGNNGGKTVKTCKIPAGLSLFIPIISVDASQGETPGASIEDLHRIAKNDQDHVTSLFLKINGTEYKYEDLLKYRIHTKDFDITYPTNAQGGASPGPSKVVADGYYILTKPLTPGNYNIEFSGSIACLEADCTEPSFVSQNIYNLIVQ